MPSKGLRALREVKEDPSIFTPDYLIVFPASDGDPDFKPNLEISRDQPPGNTVNYFYPYDENEEASASWKKKLGHKLAKHFGLAHADRWEVASWPRHYKMYEQRKGSLLTVRTDKYLYGSTNHRFRSIPEIEAHAQWLLRDPELKMARCACKYCKPNSKAWQREVVDVGTSASAGKRESTSQDVPSKVKKRASESEAVQSRAKKPRCSDEDTIRDADLLKAQKTPPEPVGIPDDDSDFSSKERAEDLALILDTHDGSCESFRVGEVVLLSLTHPIKCPDDQPGSTISKWPVVIEERDLESTQHGEGRGSDLHRYKVYLLGTPQDVLRVSGNRLFPLLSVDLPEFRHLSDWRQTKRLLENGKMAFSLLKDSERVAWRHVAYVFTQQVRFCKALCQHFSLTDKFRRRYGEMLPVTIGTNTSNEAGCGSSPRVDSNTECLRVEAVEDDTLRRQRSEATTLLSASTETGTNLKDDTNTYWQGLLGAERIWVGDLVRLGLSEADVMLMMTKLSDKRALIPKDDPKANVTTSSYLLRIKAIYRSVKAKPTPTDSGIRIVGDVYRVVEKPSKVSLKQRSVSVASLGALSQRSNEAAQTEMVRSPSPPTFRSNSRNSLQPSARHFLDEKNDTLPASAHLPVDYCLQRVNKSIREVIFPLASLAGRLYCTLADQVRFEDGRHALVRRELAKSLKKAKRDEQRTLLSLSGLLSGAIKAAKVTRVSEDTDANEAREEILTNVEAAFEAELVEMFGDGSADDVMESEERFIERTNGVANSDDGSGEQEYDSAEENDEPMDEANAEFVQDVAKLAVDVFGDADEEQPDFSSTPNMLLAADKNVGNSAEGVDGHETELPEGWVARVSRTADKGKAYYRHLATGKKVWTRPS